MTPDASDVSRQNKTGRNINEIHSIDGSLVTESQLMMMMLEKAMHMS